jgi:hypothetical protein
MKVIAINGSARKDGNTARFSSIEVANGGGLFRRDTQP